MIPLTEGCPDLFRERYLGNPAPIFFRLFFAAGPLPVGAAKTRAARRALGVLQGVLEQVRLQRQAQRLGQPARGALEARDDRIGPRRVAGGEPCADELPARRVAVVEVALAPSPGQGLLVGVDAVAEFERNQLVARLADEQVEVIVVVPAPLARRVVLQYAEDLSQHRNAPAHRPRNRNIGRRAQAKVSGYLLALPIAS